MINPLFKTDDLNTRRKRIIAEKTLEWCKANMGTRRANLEFVVKKAGTTARQNKEQGHFKFWCNQMVIYSDMCPSVRSLISVVIHEYTHFLQPMERDYVRLHHQFGYYKHPFEIEARANERLWSKCYADTIKPYLLECGL